MKHTEFTTRCGEDYTTQRTEIYPSGVLESVIALIEEYAYWTKVLAFLLQQDRPCMAANMPAIIPDLTNWQRAIASENVTPAQALGEPLRTIWCFCKEQADWVTTRDLLRKGFTALREANTEKVKEYFLILKNSGYGEIDESGNSIKFKVF